MAPPAASSSRKSTEGKRNGVLRFRPRISNSGTISSTAMGKCTERGWKRPTNCSRGARSIPSGGASNRSAVKSSKNRTRTPATRNRSGSVRNERVIESRHRSGRNQRIGSCQDFRNHSSRFDAGEFLLQSLKRVIKFVVIETQEIEHGRVQIAHLDRILYDFVSQFIGLAEGHSGFHTAASHPNS